MVNRDEEMRTAFDDIKNFFRHKVYRHAGGGHAYLCGRIWQMDKRFTIDVYDLTLDEADEIPLQHISLMDNMAFENNLTERERQVYEKVIKTDDPFASLKERSRDGEK